MKREHKKNINKAEESLDDILKRIKPFMPKPPKAKEKPQSEWKLTSSGELPSINSTL